MINRITLQGVASDYGNSPKARAKTTVLCCKYGGRRLFSASTTPAAPLVIHPTYAYQCGFFYA